MDPATGGPSLSGEMFPKLAYSGYGQHIRPRATVFQGER